MAFIEHLLYVRSCAKHIISFQSALQPLSVKCFNDPISRPGDWSEGRSNTLSAAELTWNAKVGSKIRNL